MTHRHRCAVERCLLVPALWEEEMKEISPFWRRLG
jgi:hypothetical protein